MLFHSNFWSFRNLNGKQLFRTSQLRADQTNFELKHSFSNHMFDIRLGHLIIIKGCEPFLQISGNLLSYKFYKGFGLSP